MNSSVELFVVLGLDGRVCGFGSFQGKWVRLCSIISEERTHHILNIVSTAGTWLAKARINVHRLLLHHLRPG